MVWHISNGRLAWLDGFLAVQCKLQEGLTTLSYIGVRMFGDGHIKAPQFLEGETSNSEIRYRGTKSSHLSVAPIFQGAHYLLVEELAG